MHACGVRQTGFRLRVRIHRRPDVARTPTGSRRLCMRSCARTRVRVESLVASPAVFDTRSGLPRTLVCTTQGQWVAGSIVQVRALSGKPYLSQLVPLVALVREQRFAPASAGDALMSWLKVGYAASASPPLPLYISPSPQHPPAPLSRVTSCYRSRPTASFSFVITPVATSIRRRGNTYE
jgi:hypothetical protein